MLIRTVIFCLIEDALRGLSGPLGIRLRRSWYRRRFHICGRELTIETGVVITGAGWISLGDRVWIDTGCVLIAGPAAAASENPVAGILSIGSDSHIGIRTVLQAHGGLTAGSGFTTAPDVKIYTYSNDQHHSRDGTLRSRTGAADGHKTTPVRIGRNVWLGMNTVMVGHSIGDDCFVRPNAVVSADIPTNSIASGDPAIRLKARFPEDKAAR